MENEPKLFDPADVKSEIDPTIPENNPEKAREQLKHELEKEGLKNNFIIPGDSWEDAA